MILFLWFACFASFAWATRSHFLNQGRFTVGMKWTFGLGALFSLLQLVALKPSRPASICFSLSLSLFWWTIHVTRNKGLGACYASIDSKELVVNGPYRWVRHPFYTSYLLAWLAGGFLHPALLVAFVTMGWIYWKASVEEESRFLAGPRAQKYRDYRQRTGRFFICLACCGKPGQKSEA
jgi:protein-S-isoprenylcysteine O-methyltransferase Ste14